MPGRTMIAAEVDVYSFGVVAVLVVCAVLVVLLAPVVVWAFWPRRDDDDRPVGKVQIEATEWSHVDVDTGDVLARFGSADEAFDALALLDGPYLSPAEFMAHYAPALGAQEFFYAEDAPVICDRCGRNCDARGRHECARPAVSDARRGAREWRRRTRRDQAREGGSSGESTHGPAGRRAEPLRFRVCVGRLPVAAVPGGRATG